MRVRLDQADAFTGLPRGTAKPLRFLAAFQEAEPYLGLPVHAYKLVAWLVKQAQPQDWEEGSRPIAWPSARHQAEFLGLSPARVKQLNRAPLRGRRLRHARQRAGQALRPPRSRDKANHRGLRLRPAPHSGRAAIEGHREWLLQLVGEGPDLTLAEIRSRAWPARLVGIDLRDLAVLQSSRHQV